MVHPRKNQQGRIRILLRSRNRIHNPGTEDTEANINVFIPVREKETARHTYLNQTVNLTSDGVFLPLSLPLSQLVKPKKLQFLIFLEFKNLAKVRNLMGVYWAWSRPYPQKIPNFGCENKSLKRWTYSTPPPSGLRLIDYK